MDTGEGTGMLKGIHDRFKAKVTDKMYMSVGVMKDYKLKLRKLRTSSGQLEFMETEIVKHHNVFLQCVKQFPD
jgi:hypothetical protein